MTHMGVKHAAGQAALSHSLRPGVETHLTRIILQNNVSAIPVSIDNARIAAESLRMMRNAQNSFLSRQLQVYKGANVYLLAAAMALYMDNDNCRDTDVGRYSTQVNEGNYCAPKLGLSRGVVDFLALPDEEQDRFLALPQLCRFYSDLARELRKREFTGAVTGLGCGSETPPRPAAFRASIDDKTYDVRAVRAPNGQIQKLTYKDERGEKTEFLFAEQSAGLKLTTVYDTNANGARTVLPSLRLQSLIHSAIGALPDSHSGRKLAMLRSWNSSRIAMDSCCKDPGADFCGALRGDPSTPAPAAPSTTRPQ